jgi:hypothetical protein
MIVRTLPAELLAPLGSLMVTLPPHPGALLLSGVFVVVGVILGSIIVLSLLRASKRAGTGQVPPTETGKRGLDRLRGRSHRPCPSSSLFSSAGWPFIGVALDFFADVNAYLERRRATMGWGMGPFRMKLLGRYWTIVYELE